MSIHLQPPVPLVKTEPPAEIKNEPPEEALEEEINTDVKEDIDIVYRPLCEDLIKSETVLEDILENKHLESMQIQAVVKTENSPFIKTENITKRNKSEDISDGNVSKGIGQGVVEVQASNEHFALSSLETDEQSILNFSKDLNSISTRNRKEKQPEKTNFGKCYKTAETISWDKDKERIKVNKASVIPIGPHEYTSLAKDRHVCNHCHHAYNRLDNLKLHIKRLHREVTTMYQCPYCSHKTKWSRSIKNHIIQKHKDTKDIQWFQCNLCEKKFKLKNDLTKHKKVHLKHKQIQDGLDLRRHHCNKCNYRTDRSAVLKRHKLNHLKPKDIPYFHCYHCSYKAKRKENIEEHIFRHHFTNVKQAKRHHCKKCDYKTYTSTDLKKHNLTHLKPEEIQYFYCYHCSYKSKQKSNLKFHIFTHHFKNVKQGKWHHCDKCDYNTYASTSLKRHKLIHLKPEEIQ